MEATANVFDLFQNLDATDIDSKTYEFNVTTGSSPAAIVDEGEEVPRNQSETRTVTATFEELPTTRQQKQLALDTVRREANAVLADGEIDERFDTLFIDRERQETYLVDADKMGYRVTQSEDPVTLDFVVLYPDKLRRLR
jgi:hypothetical protein